MQAVYAGVVSANVHRSLYGCRIAEHTAAVGHSSVSAASRQTQAEAMAVEVTPLF